MNLTHALLGLAPFADVSPYWHFPFLLILVNFIYSATRYDDPKLILIHAFKGIIYILFFLGIVFVVLFLLGNVLPAWLRV